MPHSHSPISNHWRWLGLALLGLTPVAGLQAQDQLTPATVAAWNATGVAPVVAPGQSMVTVPAGGQLARTYPAGRLSVQVVSRPFFGTAADKCPALEVGPASVTFVRTADGGGMLLLGDKALSLPQAIALGADGRSVQAIDFGLSYDHAGNQAALRLDGTTYTVAATSNAAQLEVVVSAGGAMAWPLDTLAVTSTPSSASDTAAASRALGTHAAPTLGSMQAALRFRAALAEAVSQGTETPEAALQRLRQQADAGGLGLTGDADLGYAALDIGHRLLAAHRPEAAEVFFRAAETGFDQAASRTPRGLARERAGYLEKLAFVRGNYLDKLEQAQADIDKAIGLQPDNPALRETRRLLASGRSNRFKADGQN